MKCEKNVKMPTYSRTLVVIICVCVWYCYRMLWRRQSDVTSKEHDSVISDHVTANWWWCSTYVR